MWRYKVEQKTFEVSGVSMGGIPGQRPIVLIGSIFYQGHKIVFDERTGEFDRKKAEELIYNQQEVSDRIGNPCMIDVVISRKQLIEKYLGFVADVTDAPILVDCTSTNVKLAALDYIGQCGIGSRIILNSVQPTSNLDEFTRIRDSGVQCAILLAYDSRNFTYRGRINAVKKLLPTLYEAGVVNPLIDTCVLDLVSLGHACKAIYDLKDELGLPSGCGPHNAIALWKGLKNKIGQEANKPCSASAMAITSAIGADFILYGPIEDAEFIFPAVAMVDTAFSQVAIENGLKMQENHPRFKIA